MDFTKIDSKAILAAVDYTAFRGIISDCPEFYGEIGREHYKLLSYLSTFYNGETIIDIGTHRGSSALALSYNPSNTIYTFDIHNKVENAGIKSRDNIVFSFDNLFEPAAQATWKARILSAPFIFLDVDPHNGSMEIEFYTWLKKIDYKGFVICDDIWYFKEMRDNFWYRVPAGERHDLTHLGHWSGTGIINFSNTTRFPFNDNSAWTLVTAYFDLTKCPDASEEIRKRDSHHYLQNAVSTMALPYNLVVYCEEDTVEALKAMRPEYLAGKTRYIVCKFDSLCFEKGGAPLKECFAEYRGRIIKNRQEHPYNFDNRNTASYYLFCMSRYLMLKETIEINPFASTHFAWINICI